MRRLTIQITLDSHTLIGSGEGFGAIIDADVVFDDIGIPYIPAKRIKGCLRDSAKDVKKMFSSSGIPFPMDIDATFGVGGEHAAQVQEQHGQVYFSDFMIEEHDRNAEWLTYLSSDSKYRSLLSRDVIRNAFTTLRQQTAIDSNGVAQKHSLRTIRVLQRGYRFYGPVEIWAEDHNDIVNCLAFACLNLRNLGTKRNRGFGEVSCRLLDEQGQEIQVMHHI